MEANLSTLYLSKGEFQLDLTLHRNVWFLKFNHYFQGDTYILCSVLLNHFRPGTKNSLILTEYVPGVFTLHWHWECIMVPKIGVFFKHCPQNFLGQNLSVIFKIRGVLEQKCPWYTKIECISSKKSHELGTKFKIVLGMVEIGVFNFKTVLDSSWLGVWYEECPHNHKNRWLWKGEFPWFSTK